MLIWGKRITRGGSLTQICTEFHESHKFSCYSGQSLVGTPKLLPRTYDNNGDINDALYFYQGNIEKETPVSIDQNPMEKEITATEESVILGTPTSTVIDKEVLTSQGILRLDPRKMRSTTGILLSPQQVDLPSPQPSVDRLSVTFAIAEEESGTEEKEESQQEDTKKVVQKKLYHRRSENGKSSCIQMQRIPPIIADDGEAEAAAADEDDYSASVCAILQRRTSTKRQSTRRRRRPSSPFGTEAESNLRRRSSAFTTSSGDTAISLEEGTTQEQIFEKLKLHKEVLSGVKQQPWPLRRKIKLVRQAKAYIRRHEGALQERLAQSRSTKDVIARASILLNKKWQYCKREIVNLETWLVPWERRIKEIESHFGSAVASYFTFLRWLFWINFVIAATLAAFVAIPEMLTADAAAAGERKIMLPHEKKKSTHLLTLWEFKGVIEYSPFFYGWYSNADHGSGYRLPLAYFVTNLVVYTYSFFAILRKMAENSRMSKLSEKEDECAFSWKLFTGWDFMIGNQETAHNRIASIVLGFKEALLEEAERQKDQRNWKIISRRVFVNTSVLLLLALSAYAVIEVVARSTEIQENSSWWRKNEITIVMSLISFVFPIFFEILGIFESYHPRKQLRMQLARIMALNLLNLYSLIFALFKEINRMEDQLQSLKPKDPEPISKMKCKNILVPCKGRFSRSLATLASMSLLLTNNSIGSDTTNSYSDLSEFGTRDSTTDENLIIFNNNYNKQSSHFPSSLSSSPSSSPSTVSSSSSSSVFYPSLSSVSYSSSTASSPTSSLSSSEVPPSVPISPEFPTTESDFFTSSPSNSKTSDSSFTTTEEYDGNLEDADYNGMDVPHLNYEYYEYLENFFETTSSSSPSTKSEEFPTETNLEAITTDNNGSNSISAVPTTSIVTETTENSEDAFGAGKYGRTINIMLHEQDYFTESSNLPENNDYDNHMSTEKDNSVIRNEIVRCYERVCESSVEVTDSTDEPDTSTPKLDIETRKELRKLCWETLFGQELSKLTAMDLMLTIFTTMGVDFFRAVFVRFMNNCWCWDLEKQFPQYGDFKIAENILHLVNNQGLIWMGMFFSPGLTLLNVVKLGILMYLRSWAVLTCNVPHEVVFRASRSNNFYLALLLTMLFLCVLPVGYAIVWVEPSWHCGPFSGYYRIYYLATLSLKKSLPQTIHKCLDYISSPGIVIPLIVLMALIIYYMASLTGSLREANNDLKIQLRHERTEERRKMFKIAERGQKAHETPFSRWKKILPSANVTHSFKPPDESHRFKGVGDEIMAKIAEDKARKRSITSEADEQTDVEQESLPHDSLVYQSDNNKVISFVHEEQQKVDSDHQIEHLDNETNVVKELESDIENSIEQMDIKVEDNRENNEKNIPEIRIHRIEPANINNKDSN